MKKHTLLLLLQTFCLVSLLPAAPAILTHQAIEDGQWFLQLNAKYGKILESTMEEDSNAFSRYGINFRFKSDAKVSGEYSWLPSATLGYYWNRSLAFWGMYELGSYWTSHSTETALAATAGYTQGYSSYDMGYNLALTNIDYMGYYLGAQYFFAPANKYVCPYLKAGAGLNQVSYRYSLTYGKAVDYDSLGLPAIGITQRRSAVYVDANEFLFGGYFGLGTDILIYKFLKLNLEANFNLNQSANKNPSDNYTVVSKNDFNVYQFNQGTFDISNYAIRMGFKFLVF